MATTATDLTEARARELQRLLTERGVPCLVHWDRSPWGVRIPLTASDDEYAPALYALTEGTQTVAGHDDTWVWIGQLGNFGEAYEYALYDTEFRWLERHWTGDGVEHVADVLVPLVRILRDGATAVKPTLADDGEGVTTGAIIRALADLGTEAHEAFQPSELSIPIPGEGQVLATRDFNRDDGGWEAVFEDATKFKQTPLFDGPDSSQAPAANVAAWLDRVARDWKNHVA
jgi:hypothetical protein